MKPDVLICGAGMAGAATAYHLAVRQGIKNVVIVDEREPLTLTSNKGTEAYRNWWPGPGDTMVRFMNRSIDLLEELVNASDNAFRLNQRGYIYFSADPRQIDAMKLSAAEISALGAGPVRLHPGPVPYQPSPALGFRDGAGGADILDRDLIREHFPYINENAVGALHARRCGWMDAKRLGAWLLEQAQAHGAQLIQDRVERIQAAGDRYQCVEMRSGEVIESGALIVAAGPLLPQLAAQVGLDIPLTNELHGKIALRDDLRLVPRDIPLLIWNDPVTLPWSDSERESLSQRPETRYLLERFAPGVHIRTRGDDDNPMILILWPYEVKTQEAVWPPVFDPHFADILLRGISHLIPALCAYIGRAGEAYIDGGYYCKTRENRPLIGPLPVQGAYVIGALSGFGVMGSQAAAELVAAHVTGAALPDYAPAFLLERYADPAYQAQLKVWDALSGQL